MMRAIAIRLFLVGCSVLLAGQTVPVAAQANFYSDQDILWYDENAQAPTQCSLGGALVNSTVTTAFNLGSDPRERRTNLMKALIADFGLTPTQAAGPVGNFMHESGGQQLPPNVNEGGNAGPPKFRGGYGWAQWTGSRQVTFIDFAVAGGYMASRTVDGTDAANYAYLKKELTEGYTITISELKKQTTPEAAAVSFEATFEKAGVPALEQRKAGARQAFEEFSGGGLTSGSSTSCTGEGSASIVGGVAFPLLGSKSVVNNPGMFNNNNSDQGGHPYIAYDILADPGVPVAAFTSGTVTKIGSDRCPGRLISIYNEESNLTISYLHLATSNHVALGDVVAAGDRVGVVGSDANGCGIAHLHIDAVQGRVRVGCSRLSCPDENKQLFVSIGPQLYETFQAMPE